MSDARNDGARLVAATLAVHEIITDALPAGDRASPHLLIAARAIAVAALKAADMVERPT